MSVWFEGSIEIESTIQRVKDSLGNYGELYVGVVSRMSGLTSVELVEQGNDFVTIRTNEGLMQRTSISTRVDEVSVAVEFDEMYQAGKMVTATSHFLAEFKTSEIGVILRNVISDVKAPGILGFIYRMFGKSNIGNDVLKSYKAYYEGA